MRIAMYDLEGHFLELFEVEHIFELEQKLKTPKGGIVNCLLGNSLSTKYYQFKRVTNPEKFLTRIGDVSFVKIGQSYKPVHKFYKGKFVCTYDNMVIAAKINNINDRSISQCCLGKQKTAGGFQWKYAE